MKILQRFMNLLKLFSIKRNEAIYTCLKNNIPLTDENINEIKQIIKHKKELKDKQKIKNN